MTLNKKVLLYLDYVNNFLSVENFSDAYCLTLKQANKVIAEGKKQHELEVAANKHKVICKVMLDTQTKLLLDVYYKYKTILSVKDNGAAKSELKEIENNLYFLETLSDSIAKELGTTQKNSKRDLDAAILFYKEEARKDIDAANKQLSFLDN